MRLLSICHIQNRGITGAPHQLPQLPHEDQVPRVEHVDKPRSPAVPAGPRPEEHCARPQRAVPGDCDDDYADDDDCSGGDDDDDDDDDGDRGGGGDDGWDIVLDLSELLQCDWLGCQLGSHLDWELPHQFYAHVAGHAEEVSCNLVIFL